MWEQADGNGSGRQEGEMRDILFALWGGAIASAWWAVAIFGVTTGQGTLILSAGALSMGMIVYIIVKGTDWG